MADPTERPVPRVERKPEMVLEVATRRPRELQEWAKRGDMGDHKYTLSTTDLRNMAEEFQALLDLTGERESDAALGWQPIETAPKNSHTFIDPVLLKLEHTWIDEESGEPVVVTRYVHVGFLMPSGWALNLMGVAGLTGGSALLCLAPPTHWMPLPPAPDTEQVPFVDPRESQEERVVGFPDMPMPEGE